MSSACKESIYHTVATVCVLTSADHADGRSFSPPLMLRCSARPLIDTFSLARSPLRSRSAVSHCLRLRTMSTAPAPISGRPFRLAMIQLAAVGDGSDKAANLAHAKEMIAKAMQGGKDGRKPDVVVLPVRQRAPLSVSTGRIATALPAR